MTSSTVFAEGNTAVITGGASGVGLAIAQLCLNMGMNLNILDNDWDNLHAAKDAFKRAEKQKVNCAHIDVSDLKRWEAVRDEHKTTFGTVDLLVLNAGIAAKGGWENSAYFHKIMDTNLFGQVHGLNTFLPLIQSQQSQKPSAIVMTGSKQGITNPPGNPAYNASKAAINFLAQHLSYDLRGSSTSVHLLVPGWTFTGLSGGGPGSTKEKPSGAWTPEQVAKYMKNKMDEKQFWIICPDNDVSEETDRKRMLWTANDAMQGRPPLSRWREEYKQEAEEWMAKVQL